MTSSFEGFSFPFCKLVEVSDSSAEGDGLESSEGHFKNVRGVGPGCRLDLSLILAFWCGFWKSHEIRAQPYKARRHWRSALF